MRYEGQPSLCFCASFQPLPNCFAAPERGDVPASRIACGLTSRICYVPGPSAQRVTAGNQSYRGKTSTLGCFFDVCRPLHSRADSLICFGSPGQPPVHAHKRRGPGSFRGRCFTIPFGEHRIGYRHTFSSFGSGQWRSGRRQHWPIQQAHQVAKISTRPRWQCGSEVMTTARSRPGWAAIIWPPYPRPSA